MGDSQQKQRSRFSCLLVYVRCIDYVRMYALLRAIRSTHDMTSHIYIGCKILFWLPPSFYECGRAVLAPIIGLPVRQCERENDERFDGGSAVIPRNLYPEGTPKRREFLRQECNLMGLSCTATRLYQIHDLH